MCYGDANTPFQDAVNEWISRIGSKYYFLSRKNRANVHWGLILETRALRTIHAFSQAFFTGLQVCPTDLGIRLVVPNPSAEEISAIRQNLNAKSPTCCDHRQRRVTALQCTSHQLLSSIFGCRDPKQTPVTGCNEPARKRMKGIKQPTGTKQTTSCHDATPSGLIADLISDESWKGYFHTVWLDYCGSISAWGRSHPSPVYSGVPCLKSAVVGLLTRADLAQDSFPCRV